MSQHPAAGTLIRSVYQPIVDLASEQVVGYEALARWTSPDRPGTPDFGDGARLGEIEWASRTAALAGALDAGLDAGTLLFVNVEPRILAHETPNAFLEVLARARQQLRLVVELTERELLSRPRELLEFADQVRDLGWGLALDDVGAHTESLAALPFLDPNVIKLDISLVQNDPSAEQARLLTGVLAHSERLGTALLAEGIETPEHLERARTLGAAFGQGYLFGRPEALPRVRVTGTTEIPGVERPRPSGPSEPDGFWTPGATRIARKPVLERLSAQLERQAANQVDPSVLLMTFQHADRLAPVAERLRQVAAACRFVGVLGVDMPPEPVAGVRGAAVPADDPLTQEWTIVVVSAHYAGALIAREIEPPHGTGPVADQERRFAFQLTHVRDTVVETGRRLLRRFEKVPG